MVFRSFRSPLRGVIQIKVAEKELELKNVPVSFFVRIIVEKC